MCLEFETSTEDGKSVLLKLASPEECIHYLPWLRLIPYANRNHWWILGHCLTGFMQMYIGYLNDDPVGLIVTREESKGEITVYAIYVPDYLALFRETFYSVCLLEGYNRVHFVSTLPERAAKKLFEPSTFYGIYTKEL